MNNLKKIESLKTDKMAKIKGKVVNDKANYHIMGKTSSDDHVCIASVSHFDISDVSLKDKEE